MAILKAKEVSKMDMKVATEKIKELKLELMKSKAATQKSSGKTKELKRAIARLLTFNSARKTMEKNK